jgi:hypothetical protein
VLTSHVPSPDPSDRRSGRSRTHSGRAEHLVVSQGLMPSCLHPNALLAATVSGVPYQLPLGIALA